jgi:predicted aconitase
MESQHMQLTHEQQAMLAGEYGRSVRKAMEILTALGKIYAARRLVPVSSVQIAGVSYDNLGEAGLNWLAEMAAGGGKAQVLATLNPAGMDIENWPALGISPDFAAQQQRVIEAFGQMGVVTTCTCTPYLVGNLPHFGEHIAWAESSAVCYANSVLGARSNREGGPSALAAALTGFTPEYGLHLDQNRQPGITVAVKVSLSGTDQFGALGKIVGERIEKLPNKPVPYLTGIEAASVEELKSFCASIATYGGVGLFHMAGITPEAGVYGSSARGPQEGQSAGTEGTDKINPDVFCVEADDLALALRSMNDASAEEIDFVSLGCPHLSLQELARVAGLLRGKQVKKTFWITTARPTKQMADRIGLTQIIEASGAIIAADTCCVVAPIRGRFTALATDSAKACYYAYAKNRFKTRVLAFDDVVMEALR